MINPISSHKFLNSRQALSRYDSGIFHALLKDLDSPKKMTSWENIKRESQKEIGAYTQDGKIWCSPEFNLAEAGKAMDVDSFVRRSFDIKHTLMFKEGYDYFGSNPQTIEYIKTRFKQISIASNKSSDLLFKELAYTVIRNNNGLLLKKRNKKNSLGKVRKQFGKTLEPIAALFEVPIETVIYQKDNGRVIKWSQDTSKLYETTNYYFFSNTPGEYKWDPEDVVHFYRNKKAGFIFGVPDIVPVLDDVRALRRIEQNVELLIYQNIHPLYHYKVGTDQLPAKENVSSTGTITTELEKVKAKINEIPPEGMLVTSHRHNIDVVGAEGKALDVKDYLEYFKQRVMIGLGVSAVDLGLADTSNRSTAESVSKNLINSVKGIQKDFEDFVNEIVKELLLEGEFSFDPLERENLVTFKFKEIDLENKIKIENHNMLQYHGNVITQDEMRNTLGKDALTDEEQKNTYLNVVEMSKLLVKTTVAPTTDKQIGATKQVKSQANPTNQHSDYFLSDERKIIDLLKKEVVDSYDKTKYTEWRSTIIDLAKQDILDTYLPKIESIFIDSSKLYKIDLDNTPVAQKYLFNIRDAVKNCIETYSKRIINKLTLKDSKDQIEDIFNSSEYLLDFLDNTFPIQTMNYVQVLDAQIRGVESVSFICDNSECKTCVNFSDKILYIKDGVDVYDIPPWHYNCKCKIKT